MINYNNNQTLSQNLLGGI